jgi:hypothetical protein
MILFCRCSELYIRMIENDSLPLHTLRRIFRNRSFAYLLFCEAHLCESCFHDSHKTSSMVWRKQFLFSTFSFLKAYECFETTTRSNRPREQVYMWVNTTFLTKWKGTLHGVCNNTVLIEHVLCKMSYTVLVWCLNHDLWKEQSVAISMGDKQEWQYHFPFVSAALVPWNRRGIIVSEANVEMQGRCCVTQVRP